VLAACGIKHRRSCLQVASSVLYTTSCKQSSAPEDGRNYRPKHVDLIEITNKLLLLHLFGFYIITRNVFYLLFFHDNYGFANSSMLCYVMCILPIFLTRRSHLLLCINSKKQRKGLKALM